MCPFGNFSGQRISIYALECNALSLTSCWCRGRLPRKSWNIFGRQLSWVLSCFCIFRHSFHFRAAMHFHSGLWLAFVTLSSIMDPLLPYHTFPFWGMVGFLCVILCCGRASMLSYKTVIMMTTENPFPILTLSLPKTRKSCTLSELVW